MLPLRAHPIPGEVMKPVSYFLFTMAGTEMNVLSGTPLAQ